MPKEATILTSFHLNGPWFCLDALQVQEVVTVPPITPVYNAPSYVEGIINLRGKIITVFNAGVRLGLAAVSRSARNRVLVILHDEEAIGLLVEAVGDIIYPASGALQPLPKNVSAEQSRLYHGVLRSEGRLYTLLNINALFAS